MKRRLALPLVLLLSTAALAQAPASPQTGGRVRLEPRFTPGQTLRYQIEIRTTSEGGSKGVMEDPQAPSKLESTTSIWVRLEVLPAKKPEAAAGAEKPPERTRMRATYEKVSVTVNSDTFDPQAAAQAEQSRKLEGHSVEFAVDDAGNVVEMSGLEEILGDERGVAAARDSLAKLARGAALPAEGIVPGQKWTTDQPIAGAPLAGLSWHTEATYLRDEPCRTPPVAEGVPAAGETCVVILTRFSMAQGATSGDPTSEEYRRRNLQASGKLSGGGESLTYISRATGWVVSVTQTGSEEMDLTVRSLESGSAVHYAGRVQSQSQISLLSASH